MKILFLSIIAFLIIGISTTYAQSDLEPYVVINQEPEKNNTSAKIPDWIRSVAGFWASGLISDDQFLNALEYIINNKLISVSNTVGLVAPSNPTVPNAPVNLTGSFVDGKIRLSWTAPINDGGSPITDYKIEYLSGGIWKEVRGPTSTKTTAVITNTKEGTYDFRGSNAQYRVSAINYIGTSVPSNSVLIKQPTTLPTPTPSATTSSITISSCGHDSLWGVVKVIGSYTADADYARVYLNHIVLDKDGNVLDVHPNDAIQDISKGETRSFEIFSRHAGEFGSCKVEIHSKYKPR